MLHFTTPQQIADLSPQRPGEKRLGESVHTIAEWNQLDEIAAPFVLLGIAEDIGVRANRGRPGTREAWNYFLPAFLGIQDNEFLHGNQVIIAGCLEFPDLLEQATSLHPLEDLDTLRDMTAEIDKVVTATIQEIVRHGKIPVVIGGGHNNCYGIIKAIAQQQKSIPVLNIDPHADFRTMEGRHSGNGFRYAHHEGWLSRYAVYGLHEGANNHDIIHQFHHSPELYYLSYDELLTFSTQEGDKLFKDTLQWLGSQRIGLELDCDALHHFPASAYNPSGLSMSQARLLIKTAAALRQPYYFHLPEAAPALSANDEVQSSLGKALGYLVTDFLKAYGKAST